jgi:hypothetical protein
MEASTPESPWIAIEQAKFFWMTGTVLLSSLTFNI